MTLPSPSILSDSLCPPTGADEVESSEEPPGPKPALAGNGAEPRASSESELIASPLGVLAGIAIALLTLAVPLASVLTDRQEPAAEGFPTSLQR